jgi:hypothetical protein
LARIDQFHTNFTFVSKHDSDLHGVLVIGQGFETSIRKDDSRVGLHGAIACGVTLPMQPLYLMNLSKHEAPRTGLHLRGIRHILGVLQTAHLNDAVLHSGNYGDVIYIISSWALFWRAISRGGSRCAPPPQARSTHQQQHSQH